MTSRQTLIRIVFFAILILVLNFWQKPSYDLNALNATPASRLLKLADDPTVYYANQYGKKLAIPSAKVFLSYGAKWEDIEIVEKPELDFYKNAEYIKLIGNARVYQLKDGGKRYLTQKAASALKIFPEEVVLLNSTEFNAYSSGGALDEQEAIVLRAQKDTAVAAEVEKQECVPNQDVGGEDGCKIFEAMEKKNPSLCDGLATEEWKAMCYTSVIPENGDVLVNCKKIESPDLENQCVLQMTVAKKDASLCSQITDPETAKNCIAYVGVSAHYAGACDNLSGDSKDNCNYTFGILNQDARSCEKISNSAMKDSCTQSIGQALSINVPFQKKAFSSQFAKAANSLFGVNKAQAQLGSMLSRPIGGRFLPGLTFDIFTVTIKPPCLIVGVAGPNPGVFSWTAPRIYDNFFEAPWHAGTNMLGLAANVPTVCPPNLNMFGSSLTP